MSTITTNHVYYLDGRVDDVSVSMWEQRIAANYMRDHNLGTIIEDPVTYSGYQAYAKLRQEGRVSTPFDEWLRTVARVEDVKPRTQAGDEGNPSTGGTREA